MYNTKSNTQYQKIFGHLLTGIAPTTASKTPGVLVTALSKVPYFPSAAAKSMMDIGSVLPVSAAIGAIAAVRKMADKNFMVEKGLML